MHRKRLVARYWLTLCAAGWLACATSARGDSPSRPTAASKQTVPSQAPLTLANPFIGQDGVPAWAIRVPADTMQSRSASPVKGEVVDADTPATYRLPNVSSFAPTPVDAAASPPPQATLPPMPPIGNPVAPQSRIAISPAPAVHKSSAPNPSSSHSAWPAVSTEPAFTVEPTPSQVFTEPCVEDPANDPRSERSVLTRDAEVTRQPAPQLEPRLETSAQIFDSSTTPNDTAQLAFPTEPIDVQPVTYTPTPTTAEFTPQLLPAVQRGFGLAQRGALYAAQTEFVQVLRRSAQAKDAAAGSGKHSRALAAGLRAIDEAEDFVPNGIQLEADLDVRIVASSHRTPVLKEYPQEVLPHDAVVLYHNYAQEQLANAVAGDQSGSMALHGLGKIYARLAARDDDDVQLGRNATTMYAAAFAARSDNHLAANELGVMLCRGGRAAEAAQLFETTIDFSPSALAYHNLAVAQGKLGMQGQAAANEQESQRLAAWERTTGAVSRRAGVQWVSPEQMSRVAQSTPVTSTTYNAAASSTPTSQNAVVSNAPPKSRWQKTVELAKSLPLPGHSKDSRELAPNTPIAQPFAPPPMPSDTQ